MSKKHARDPRYLVTVYSPDPKDRRTMTPTMRYVVGRCLASAIRRADSEVAQMASVVTTWSLRSYARSSWATVTREGSNATVYSVDQGVEYVPSIGERGY